MELTQNDRTILNMVRQNPGNTPNQISALCDIKQSSASYSFNKLFNGGMLLSNRKKAQVNSEFGYFIGISVGKCDTRICLLDFSFRPVSVNSVLCEAGQGLPDRFRDKNAFCALSADEEPVIWRFATPDILPTFKELLNEILEFSLEVARAYHVLAVSFSFGDHVDAAEMHLEFNIVQGLRRTSISLESLVKDKLECLKKNNIVIACEQNAKAAAIAEQMVGCLSARNRLKNGLVLYLGRGLGAAFIMNGRLYRGRTNAAGSHFGHQKVEFAEDFPGVPEPELCTCGGTGCLEMKLRALFGGTEIVKKSGGTELAELLNRDENQNKKRELVKYLARAVTNVCELFECDFIVFSGKLGDIYRESIGDLFDTKMLEYSPMSLEILPSTLSDNAASIGAAIAGYNKWIGEPIE